MDVILLDVHSNKESGVEVLAVAPLKAGAMWGTLTTDYRAMFWVTPEQFVQMGLNIAGSDTTETRKEWTRDYKDYIPKPDGDTLKLEDI